MRGVDQSLEHLHVVAAVDRVDIDAVAGRYIEPWVSREGRLEVRRPEIRPDYSTRLSDGIGFGTKARLECRIGNVRRLHDGAVNGKLPSVEQTSDPIALASTDDERGLSVTAPFVEYADHSLAVSKRDEAIAHDFQREGITIGRRQVGRLQHRNLVSAQSLAHRRIRADATNQLVVLLGQHSALPRCRYPRSMLSVIFHVRRILSRKRGCRQLPFSERTSRRVRFGTGNQASSTGPIRRLDGSWRV